MPTQKPNKQITYVLIILLITFIITLTLFTIFKDNSPDLLDLSNRFQDNPDIQKNLNNPDIQNNINIPNNYVIRVIDGDTIELYSGDKVRLICIDAPELENKGSYEAKAYLESLVLNKEVKLEKDISEADKYGRLLRYVWVNISDQEVFVNKELVSQGYASIFRYGDDVKKCEEIERDED
jgi:endonuclease YncB( thermonuclease family)